MSWYETGLDGVAREQERIDALTGPNRLWVPPGTGRELVWVDDDFICIHEHNAKINGNWRNWHTCLRGSYDECPSCTTLGDRSRYYIGYNTVVDCTESVDRRGNKYQYELKLNGGKLKTLKKWGRKKEEQGSLIFQKCTAFREDGNSPTCGDEFTFKGEVKDHAALFKVANYRGTKLSELFDKAEANPDAMTKLRKIFLVEFDPEDDGRLVRRVPAFNYEEVLKPRTPAQIKELIGGAEADAGGSSSSGSAKEDEVPF